MTQAAWILKRWPGFPQNTCRFCPGDTDKNGGIEVKDVLNIQKAICKMTEIGKGCCDFLFYDFNADGTIDLKDVLALQKQLAKLS